jgi:transcription initiation factor TFIIIB Brf1 subunit/transcription initiation factor TFIIB
MDLSILWAQMDEFLQVSAVPSKGHDEYTCSGCGAPKLYTNEMPVCSECGRVDEFFTSDEPEWIGDQDGGPDPSRVGAPVDSILFSGKWGMGTIISGGRGKFQKMAKINMHSNMNHKDRALYHAYQQIDSICKGNLGLNETIIDCVKLTYKTVNEAKLTRGAIRMGIKANCVLYACKKHGVQRTFQEIARAFDIPVKDISRTGELFQEVMGDDTGKTQSSDLISRLFNQVTCIPDQEKGRVRMKVIRECDAAQKNIPELMGKTPKGIASAVMFKTLTELGYDTDKAFIARICDISVPTLNKILVHLKDTS